MVIDSEGTVNVRKVTLGPTYENMIIVESGLEPNEQVAVEGMLKLRSGMKVKPVLASDQ